MADKSPLPKPEQTAVPAPAMDTAERSAPGITDFLTMGVASALCLVLAGGIGVAIDAVAHSTPLWTFVGLGFGVVAAVLVTVSLVRKNL
jgi:hypothetical protein